MSNQSNPTHLVTDCGQTIFIGSEDEAQHYAHSRRVAYKPQFQGNVRLYALTEVTA